MFPISYRDLELMLQDRGVDVAHTTLFSWTHTYAPEIGKRIRPHLRSSHGSWRVDEMGYPRRMYPPPLVWAERDAWFGRLA